MNPRAGDPLDVTPPWEADDIGAGGMPDPSPLPRFREQRRRSRWSCSVALVAIVAALVVFWCTVIFVAVNVLAAPRGAPNDYHRSEGRTLADGGEVSAFLGAPLVLAVANPRGEVRESAVGWYPYPDPVPGGAPLSAVTYTGVVNYAQPSHGRWYLAIPNGPGWRVRICGPAGCLDRTSTDAGPSLAMQRAGKIADLNSVDWQQISGVSLRYGGFQGTVLVLGRARLPETDMDSIATSGFGMHGAPRLSMSATCANSGHQAVWVAQTGTASLDIIQVGAMDGELFYAYGRGEPLGPGSLYVEEHLGPSGTGRHRYGVTLAARVWTLTIDGRTVATVPDTFRTWRLRATQVMAEGDLPFGAAACSFPAGSWHFGGYGPQPGYSFGARDWRVR